MRAVGLWVSATAALVILQVSLGHLFEIGQVKPDFFLVAVLLVAMRRGGGVAAVWGTLLGLVQDVLSGGITGFNILTKPAVGYAVGLLRPKLDFDNPNTQSLVTFLATLAEGLVLSVMLYAHQPAKNPAASLTGLVFPEAVYNGLVMPCAVIAGRAVALLAEAWRRRPARLGE